MAREESHCDQYGRGGGGHDWEQGGFHYGRNVENSGSKLLGGKKVKIF